MACIFCAIIERRAPATIVYEDEQVVAFRDIHPVAPVHVLIVPRRHIETLNDVTPEDVPTLGRCLYVARELARSQGIDGRGYRVVLNVRALAGQSVYHVHFHLLGGRAFRWPPG